MGPDYLSDYGISKLEPEPQEGATEYKLHLLLRPRREYMSTSTGYFVGGSYHSKSGLSVQTTESSEISSPKLMSPPLPRHPKSAQSRQQRLEQLTTQLLWRLQQSSPFHSASTANPVLPVLPDIKQPDMLRKPTRLLPGLEESQGALYEIGASDDGTLVGLAADELEESLANLQVMAASLGCKVEVLRRVVVGECQWNEEDGGQTRADDLWVAEALVSPDLDLYRSSSPRRASENTRSRDNRDVDGQSTTEQIRISLTGPSASGKSSLLGTLTTSLLDNGRGKSRLSLLKHRHEISSGVTSSVAQELIGYAPAASGQEDIDVVNYASGNVAAWDDIHVASDDGRLAFLSDLPGSVRYSKSTLRGLISWAPHYVMLCIPANDGEATSDTAKASAEKATGIDMCLAFLNLCIKLEVPTLVVITKMDIASRAGLKNTLARVLSALKDNRKRPIMLPVSEKTTDLQVIRADDRNEVRKLVASVHDWLSTVPIVLTSAVDGSGVRKLHAFLRYLPIRQAQRNVSMDEQAASLRQERMMTDIFDVDEMFAIPPSKVYSEDTSRGNRGVVLCGLVRYGTISVGDRLVIGPLSVDQRRESTQPSPKSRYPTGEFSNSYHQGFLSSKPSAPRWQEVLVVSVRNLRLPVRSLTQDQVGTIGVEPIHLREEPTIDLGRVRKGMLLCNVGTSALPKAAAGFVATFPCSEFSSSASPPLLLGGNAIAYISNVRATVKVTCVTLAGDEVISSPPSPIEPEFFSFDGDPPPRAHNNCGAEDYHEVNQVVASNSTTHDDKEEIRITFAFISSNEWIEIGSRVILMPGVSMVLSVNGDSVSLSGLDCFSGRVCDVFDGGGGSQEK